MEAYVLLYRPLAVSCSKDSCAVFPNWVSAESDCCTKMRIQNISKILKRTAKRAGMKGNINSRILRRSQITALWDEETDPVWLQKVAVQAGHTFSTASRYYDYSSREKKGSQVIDRLTSMRERDLARGDGSDTQ